MPPFATWRVTRYRSGRLTRRAAGGMVPGLPDQRPYTEPCLVESLPLLRQEARVLPLALQLDGGDEAPVQPEPPAGPHRRGRGAEARVRLHALPQGRQGHQARLTARGARRRARIVFRATWSPTRAFCASGRWSRERWTRSK